MHWIVPLILLMCSIASIAGGIVWNKTFLYPNINNQADCDTKSSQVNAQNKDECAVWQDQGKLCRKGQLKGDKCDSQGHSGPLIVLVVGVLLLLGAIVSVWFVRIGS